MTHSDGSQVDPDVPTRRNPPQASGKPLVHTRHGRQWSDPYAWLRDPDYPEVNRPEILAYLTAENDYFEHWRKGHGDSIEALADELRSRIPDADEGVPWRYRGYWYRWRFAAGAQYRIWERAPARTDTPPRDSYRTVLNEAALAAAGGSDNFALGGWDLAPNDRWLARSIDRSGDERFRLEVLRFPDSVQPTWVVDDTLGAPVFSACSRYLFYLALNAEWRPAQLRRLDLATGRSTLVLDEPDPGFRLGLESSQSEHYLIISSGDHETSEVHLLPLRQPLAPPQRIAARRAGHEYEVDHDGRRLVIRSNRDVANYALYAAPTATPDEAHWSLLRSGTDQRYLMGYAAFASFIASAERWQGLDQIVLLYPDGNEQRVPFPDASYVAYLGMNAEPDTRRLRIGYEALTCPSTVFDYDLDSGTLETQKVRAVPGGYLADEYNTERLLITARDGTAVPVSLVYAKRFPPQPDRPLYLYGYGAYGIATTPGFSSNRLALLNRGVTFAIAHIRGGDDLGHHWYASGKLTQRTNTFNDFVDVARALVDRGLTGKRRIAYVGGSAGGELVGAALNQDPTLPGAAVLHVPFVDVLNTMLDATLPLTPIEWPEWGNPIEDPDAFDLLLSYSPYDQLKPADYPAVLVTAGLNDPRVTYWEAAKYVARLRSLNQNDALVLLKTNMTSGHAGRSGRFEALEETAEEYAFVLAALNPDAEP
ncbi:MAG: S9 family peptidase [Pseudomonadota bacterium]